MFACGKKHQVASIGCAFTRSLNVAKMNEIANRQGIPLARPIAQEEDLNEQAGLTALSPMSALERTSSQYKVAPRSRAFMREQPKLQS